MYERVRAGADRAAAAAILVLTAPLILLLMAAVRLTSPGPAIYAQTRLGRRGVPFRIYKIRTMVHDCERLTGPRWADPDDPRATHLGRLLRRTHLDELPQLWNVLRGEMSLVGPRPERPEIARSLEKALPGYRGRLDVRPGITGLAQVLLPADSDLASVRRKLECDLDYLERRGPVLDALLLLLTAGKLVGLRPGRFARSLLIPSARSAAADPQPEPGLAVPALEACGRRTRRPPRTRAGRHAVATRELGVVHAPRSVLRRIFARTILGDPAVPPEPDQIPADGPQSVGQVSPQAPAGTPMASRDTSINSTTARMQPGLLVHTSFTEIEHPLGGSPQCPGECWQSSQSR
jgi:lipopolysaccharide/colanic/teichoic acid biosynthesis glycosyltransferase